MTQTQAAQLLRDKTHAINDDNRNFELLSKVLSEAFPDDEDTFNYPFYENCVYGYARRKDGNWTDNGHYLSDLELINLSEIEL